MKTDRNLSLPAIWNMSFGFLGIQFGWGLQMANMSAIYQFLGASESDIPLLWLAAPVTGLLVQPLVGHYSDHTWTRLGRRRPYFLVGAILASLALIAMPNASSLWMAAGLLWILDASVNISMEPFRAFVGDLLPPQQRQLGFSMQSLLIGLGAVMSSALPWALTKSGLVHIGTSGQGLIPTSVHVSFYLGAAVFLSCVLYTIITTAEYPPAAGTDLSLGRKASTAMTEIFRDLREMPLLMQRLALVQFFTWLGLFCLWIYFAPAIARGIFGGTPGTPEYQRGVEWGGVCFATYNGVAFAASFVLVALGRIGIPSRTLHRTGLIIAGTGLVTVALWTSPSQLLISMVAVGIGWATILSMPYALLANVIPQGRMGFYMGVFNFFVVIPQIVASIVLGPLVHRFLGGSAMPVVVAGGVSMFIAAAGLSWVPAQTVAPDEAEA